MTKNIEEIMNDYFACKGLIHNYFSYVPDWTEIPLEDSRQYVWKLEQNENGSGELRYAETEEDLNDEDGNYYEDSIYTNRFLPKWVYRTDKFTLVSCDTHADGNKFLRILDNSKEVK